MGTKREERDRVMSDDDGALTFASTDDWLIEHSKAFCLFSGGEGHFRLELVTLQVTGSEVERGEKYQTRVAVDNQQQQQTDGRVVMWERVVETDGNESERVSCK